LLWPQWFVTIGTLPIGLALGSGYSTPIGKLCTQPCAAIRRAILPGAQMLYLADPVGRRAGVAQW
jgi:hypothetical protein